MKRVKNGLGILFVVVLGVGGTKSGGTEWHSLNQEGMAGVMR